MTKSTKIALFGEGEDALFQISNALLSKLPESERAGRWLRREMEITHLNRIPNETVCSKEHTHIFVGTWTVIGRPISYLVEAEYVTRKTGPAGVVGSRFPAWLFLSYTPAWFYGNHDHAGMVWETMLGKKGEHTSFWFNEGKLVEGRIVDRG